jgi:hypothetical protein
MLGIKSGLWGNIGFGIWGKRGCRWLGGRGSWGVFAVEEDA